MKGIFHRPSGAVSSLCLLLAFNPVVTLSNDAELRIIQAPPPGPDQACRGFIDAAATYLDEVRQEGAVSASTSDAVRDHAMRLAFDHRLALEKLKLVAAMHHIEIPGAERMSRTTGEAKRFEEDDGRSFLEAHVERQR